MNITVFGVGYVGLVTGACLSAAGHFVKCVDINETKIESLDKDIIPIYEPGLKQVIADSKQSDRLSFTCDIAEAVDFGELQFIAVGTPPNKDGTANIENVLAVAESIAQHMKKELIVVSKSTVPVGTADAIRSRIEEVLSARQLEIKFDVCSNPEFLKEGSAINDFTKADRIIVGTDSNDVIKSMEECYAPYNRNRNKMIYMDIRSAELTKYASNAMLATKISFMNEISNIAEKVGADVENVRIGIGSDSRIGYDFIYPGCGFGGSCFPKDVSALVASAKKVGYQADFLKSVKEVNERQKSSLFKKLKSVFNDDIANKVVAVWGLSFKPNTDDIREAPSLSLLNSLREAGVQVKAYDPKAMKNIKKKYEDWSELELTTDIESTVIGSDALVICTEWECFRVVDFAWIRDKLNYPIIVDGRNLYNPTEVKKAGLLYFAVGRGDSVELF